MSCISLSLPPTRKVWKSFTCKLGKLRSMKRSKTIKKPRQHLNTISTARTTRPSKFFARRFRKKKLASLKTAIYGFHKKPSPVYIDNLFKEPTCDLVNHLKPQIAHNPRIRKISNLPDHGTEVAGPSKGGGGSDKDKPCTSDDMWESLALASPLMQGINERAEEFITRFREDMVAQEILARDL